MSATNRGLRRASGWLALLAIASLGAGAIGCASLFGKRFGEHPVTITEIEILSRHGVAPEKIIGKMRRGGTIYHLSDKQYAELRAKGVTPAVIDYMKRSYAEAVQTFPKLAEDEDLECWSLGWDGFWYAGGPFGLHPDC
jgi:hypothetical protein